MSDVEIKGESKVRAELITLPKWEYKTEFAIYAKMKEVVEKTIEVTEKQLVFYRRKIQKLTYGS